MRFYILRNFTFISNVQESTIKQYERKKESVTLDKLFKKILLQLTSEYKPPPKTMKNYIIDEEAI